MAHIDYHPDGISPALERTSPLTALDHAHSGGMYGIKQSCCSRTAMVSALLMPRSATMRKPSIPKRLRGYSIFPEGTSRGCSENLAATPAVFDNLQLFVTSGFLDACKHAGLFAEDNLRIPING